MNKTTNRRYFLINGAKTLTAITTGCYLLNISSLTANANTNKYLKRAYFYEKINNGSVKCKICPNMCIVPPGQMGKCKVKKNINGEYYTIVYSRPAVIHIDNVEKAPLYHYKPETKMLSIATAGCNLTCKYCQNWQFSQSYPNQVKSFDLTPQQIIKKAIDSECNIVSFFYTEPTVYYEYMYDTALLAKKAGLKTIMVTAGYINSKPLEYLCNVIDAFTIGLKGFNDQYYRSIVGGSIEPVKNTIKLLKKTNKHIEIVNLIVPTLNDSETELQSLIEWLKTNVGTDVPVHFSRFVPQYKLQNLPPTPINILNKARKISINNGLKYAYVDNLPGHEGQNTLCPKCKKTLIKRVGFNVIENVIKHSKCPYCNELIKGNW